MNHERIVRTVLGIAAGYVVLLAVWSSWLVAHTPPDTVPFQVVGLVGLFFFLIGIGMMLANMPSRENRRIRKRGLEGWARIEGAHLVALTDHASELTELDLVLTVPGSDSYSGRLVFDVSPIDKSRFAVGETISIRVDPHNRDRIVLFP